MGALTDLENLDEIYDALFHYRTELAERVHRRIRGAGISDVLELHDRVCDWLQIDPPSTVSERDAHVAVTRANSRAGRRLRSKHVPEKHRAATRDLIALYSGWLRRTCQHDRVPRYGPATDCPDCGATIIDLGRKPGSEAGP